jgi:glutathione S-transferase
MRKLYELVGTDPERPFSPYVWRTRLALAHKGLDAERVPWRFVEKEVIAAHGSEKVPVLVDGDKTIHDSFAIALYLEETYPDRPSLFGGPGGREYIRFFNSWGDVALNGGIFPLIITDILQLLDAENAAYFRSSREARFKMSIEDFASNREAKVDGFRRSLDPFRLTLRSQPFLGGAAPNYADYIAFGPFQWARAVSPFRLLNEDDLVYAWRERMLDAFGGMARASKGFSL